MGRFDSAGEEIVPYSDKRPERCTPARGAAFVLPGEDVERRCGEDPDMPPASDRRHGQPRVNRSHQERKR
jgi:hypothetical protein